MGIILCFDDGPATLMGGRNAGALNLGIDRLKAEGLGATFNAGDKTVAKASIIKPRH